MILSRWRKHTGPRSVAPQTLSPRRPCVEVLEDRTVPSTVWYVDDDLQQRPTAAFRDISAAVAAAQAGDTIRVLAGTYNESVTVDKSLVLVGTRGQTIVDPEDNQVAFSLQANNIALTGFVIQGATNNAGVFTSPDFSGYLIRDNIFRNNTFGLYLNSSGTRRSIVEGNLFGNSSQVGAAPTAGAAGKVGGTVDNEIAAGLGGNRNVQLRGHAERTGGKAYWDWPDAGLTSHTQMRGIPPETFGKIAEGAFTKTKRIHFDLTNLGDPVAAANEGARLGWAYNNLTKAELNLIRSRPDLLEKTTFYLNGVEVPNPFK